MNKIVQSDEEDSKVKRVKSGGSIFLRPDEMKDIIYCREQG
jgi:hypothetical protein